MGRDQANQVATRAAERQRMEDELRARVEAAERVAVAAGHPDLDAEEVLYNEEIGWLHCAKEKMRSCKDRYGQQIPTIWVAPK